MNEVFEDIAEVNDLELSVTLKESPICAKQQQPETTRDQQLSAEECESESVEDSEDGDAADYDDGGELPNSGDIDELQWSLLLSQQLEIQCFDEESGSGTDQLDIVEEVWTSLMVGEIEECSASDSEVSSAVSSSSAESSDEDPTSCDEDTMSEDPVMGEVSDVEWTSLLRLELDDPADSGEIDFAESLQEGEGLISDRCWDRMLFLDYQMDNYVNKSLKMMEDFLASCCFAEERVVDSVDREIKLTIKKSVTDVCEKVALVVST